ncbi:MAG: hypothetical protein GY736_09815 [Sphingomonas sp.]|uniref:hypothetical protein n=1 Tax=Sphingomonas sp. TaxID=28214 RepID=UPI002588F07A|nr:hypothetical protein [Sphingomonas sp.]MCP4026589.1 hypothetical protein [Sphingomonas sp.]
MPGYAVYLDVRPEVEEPLWRALSAAAAPATVHELHLATAAHPNAIQHRLSRWVSAGLVTRTEGSPRRFAMTDTTERTPRPPRVDLTGRIAVRRRTAREALWSAMRVLSRHGSFDVPTLQMTAGVSRRSTEEMLNVLHRSGHVRQLARGNSQTGSWSTYRLVRNTGPKAPVVRQQVADGVRRRLVVDGNTGIATDISPAAVSLRRKDTDPAAAGGEG